MEQQLSELIKILKELNSSVSVIANNVWIRWSAMATIFLVAVTVYVANKDFFHNLFWRPKIEIDEKIHKNPQHQLIYWRLGITNKHIRIAKNVSFVVGKLKYKINNNWQMASNFLSFPLRWTYYDKDKLDLSKKTSYCLDLCETTNNNTSICTCVGSPRHHGLDDLINGENRIYLMFYGDNLRAKWYVVNVSVDSNKSELKLKFLSTFDLLMEAIKGFWQKIFKKKN